MPAPPPAFLHGVECPEPGIYPGVPEEEYRAWPAVNSSLLKAFDKTPAHAYEYRINPPGPTPDKELGQGVHCALLRPHDFDDEFVRGYEGDRRRQPTKGLWEKLRAEHPTSTVMVPKDYDRAIAMRDAVLGSARTRELLIGGDGVNEVSVVWDEMGLRCKARMDRLTMFEGWPCAVDLKSCEDASWRGFQKQCVKYRYDVQAAWYIRGLNALDPRRDRRFLFLAIEKGVKGKATEPFRGPFLPVIYELDHAGMELGGRAAMRFLEQYERCCEDEDWPGYHEGVTPMAMPEWMYSAEPVTLGDEED